LGQLPVDQQSPALVKDGGWLVAINNALYVSGEEFHRTLESLCADGYLKIAELIPVPEMLPAMSTPAGLLP